MEVEVKAVEGENGVETPEVEKATDEEKTDEKAEEEEKKEEEEEKVTLMFTYLYT